MAILDLSKISRKRCKIEGKLVIITNRKSYMGFRLVPKSVTLNDLERRNGRRRLDVCHTSTHGVALVRIEDAGLKRAARGSLKIQDEKNSPKIAIWAPSHNFVVLYIRN